MIIRIATKKPATNLQVYVLYMPTRHALIIDQCTLHRLIITPTRDVCQVYLQQIYVYVALWAACPFAKSWLNHFLLSAPAHPI